MSYQTIPAAEIPETHPVRAYLRHFEEHKTNKGVLSGLEFDPLQVTSLLPWVLILDIVPGHKPPAYRYRFAGPKCCDLFGIDYTGKMLGDDLPLDAAEQRREEFHEVVAGRVPVFAEANVPLPGREHKQVYRGVFPLAKRASEVIDQLHVVIAPTHALT